MSRLGRLIEELIQISVGSAVLGGIVGFFFTVLVSAFLDTAKETWTGILIATAVVSILLLFQIEFGCELSVPDRIQIPLAVFVVATCVFIGMSSMYFFLEGSPTPDHWEMEESSNPRSGPFD